MDGFMKEQVSLSTLARLPLSFFEMRGVVLIPPMPFQKGETVKGITHLSAVCSPLMKAK